MSPEPVRSDVRPPAQANSSYTPAARPPAGAVKRFIDWALSPAGQRVVVEAGYVPLWGD